MKGYSFYFLRLHVNRFFPILLIGLLLLCMSACSGGGGNSPAPSASATLTGIIQKGPFILGTTIYIYELDDNLDQTGTVNMTMTYDDFGSFTYKLLNQRTRYVEVVADGFYIDEMAGGLSTSRILLRSVEDLGTNASLSVNVLTTLQANRIKALVCSGRSFADAFSQSENEVLAIFGIRSDAGFARTTVMRIDGSTDSDAALLSASAILLQMAYTRAGGQATAPAELSSYLSQIAIDIGADGGLDNGNVLNALRSAAQALDLSAVRNNIEAYYAGRGVPLSAPLFEEWVDKAGTGLLPARTTVAPSDFSFTPVANAAPTLEYVSDTITVNGIGGQYLETRVTSNGTMLKNGSAVAGSYTTVMEGDTLAVKTTAGDFDTSQTVTLTVGNMARDFVVATSPTPRIGYAYGLGNYANGGSCDNGTYVALPIKPSFSFSARYMGAGLLYPVGGTSVSLRTDNGGQPGSLLDSTSTIGRFRDEMRKGFLLGIDGQYYSIMTIAGGGYQAYFGSAGVPLTAGVNYWVVIQYPSPQALCAMWQINPVVAVPFSTCKVSDDGVSWGELDIGGGPTVGPRMYVAE